MDRVTLTIQEEQNKLLNKLSGDDGPYDNRSEAMRNIIFEYERADQLQAENNDLRRQLREANRRNRENEQLANYVEREKELQTEERERRRAPLIRRIYWLLYGRD